MRFWIDTEFNGHQGELISMALVSEDGREWYEVTHCPRPGLWVAEHVMPLLGKSPISRRDMALSLAAFLRAEKIVHLVADWPADIAHFCDLLIVAPGIRVDTPALTMEVHRDMDDAAKLSEVPHNALSDARGLRAWQLAQEN